MRIRQILNNNVALVKRGDNEVFVVSKGIGFRKTKGQQISPEEIEKVYVLDSYDMLEHFSYLLQHSDEDVIMLVQDIISYAENQLQIKANDYLSLTLFDHLEFLFKRAEKQQFIKSPLIWNIKRFYPKHYQIGLHALKIIEQHRGILLPEDEAISLALHFVNLEKNNPLETNYLLEVQSLGDIVTIVSHHFNLIFEEDSTNYLRFITHLQYFIARMKSKDAVQQEQSSALYQQVSELYPEAFKAVQKIKIYVQSQFGVSVSESEETYLMLHINRITERLEDK